MDLIGADQHKEREREKKWKGHRDKEKHRKEERKKERMNEGRKERKEGGQAWGVRKEGNLKVENKRQSFCIIIILYSHTGMHSS